MGQKFFICKHCGNIIGMINDAGVPMTCCGEVMNELIPNTVDAAKEKHVPVVTIEGDKVTVAVGSIEHPMIDAHFIQWIYIETKHGGQRKSLHPNDKPTAAFILEKDEVVAVYEYCNLHGLWKTEI